MTMGNSFKIRRSDERGHANHGWLDSYHTFSFATYHDPDHMGFRSLRVINDDRIAPQAGFPTHPHRDMEIFSYVLEGQLAHRDSMGNSKILAPGQIQVMSAGSGVTHSEFNPSPTEPGHFLQIWIQPRQRGLPPRYTEFTPPPGSTGSPKTLLISPDGRDGSATIAQDAWIWRLTLQPGQQLTHSPAPGHAIWLHLIAGSLESNGQSLLPGDAASSESPLPFSLTASSDPVEALLFELA
jgi:redox-sensitive bicupin YhaK (pirin superfamily)